MYARPQSLYKCIMVSGVMASPSLRLQPLELFTTSHSVWKFITAVIPNSCLIFTVTCSTCRGQLPSQTRGSTLEATNRDELIIYLFYSLFHCEHHATTEKSLRWREGEYYRIAQDRSGSAFSRAVFRWRFKGAKAETQSKVKCDDECTVGWGGFKGMKRVSDTERKKRNRQTEILLASAVSRSREFRVTPGQNDTFYRQIKSKLTSADHWKAKRFHPPSVSFLKAVIFFIDLSSR